MILNRKVRNVYNQFEKEVDDFIHSLKIDSRVEIIIIDLIERNPNPVPWGNYFWPIINYYRSTYSNIINQAVFVLRFELESFKAPPIKPVYQLKFRAFLQSRFNGLTANIIKKVEPTIERFNILKNTQTVSQDIQTEFFKVLYEQDYQVTTNLTNLFNYYNGVIRPFKDNVKSIIAIIISILAIIISVIISFRNEIWNLLHH